MGRDTLKKQGDFPLVFTKGGINMNYHLKNLVKNYPELEKIENEMSDLIELAIQTYKNGNKILVAGNGGSAADAEHIVGELMKSFVKERPIDKGLQNKIISLDQEDGKRLVNNIQKPFEAIALTGHIALATAFNNDVSSEYGYAQQVLGYAKENDLFIGISTSGKAKNIYVASLLAKALKVTTVLLTGENKSKTSELVDLVIHVPSGETYRIQEYHLPIYHCLCLSIEDYFF